MIDESPGRRAVRPPHPPLGQQLDICRTAHVFVKAQPEHVLEVLQVHVLGTALVAAVEKRTMMTILGHRFGTTKGYRPSPARGVNEMRRAEMPPFFAAILRDCTFSDQGQREEDDERQDAKAPRRDCEPPRTPRAQREMKIEPVESCLCALDGLNGRCLCIHSGMGVSPMRFRGAVFTDVTCGCAPDTGPTPLPREADRTARPADQPLRVLRGFVVQLRLFPPWRLGVLAFIPNPSIRPPSALIARKID